mgnify:CR=1 FL=1
MTNRKNPASASRPDEPPRTVRRLANRWTGTQRRVHGIGFLAKTAAPPTIGTVQTTEVENRARQNRLLVGLRGGSPDPDAATISQRLSRLDNKVFLACRCPSVAVPAGLAGLPSGRPFSPLPTTLTFSPSPALRPLRSLRLKTTLPFPACSAPSPKLGGKTFNLARRKNLSTSPTSSILWKITANMASGHHQVPVLSQSH